MVALRLCKYTPLKKTYDGLAFGGDIDGFCGACDMAVNVARYEQ